jgi:integrase
LPDSAPRSTGRSIWASPGGVFPGKGLVFPKLDEKPPFQTIEEIERRLGDGGLSGEEKEGIWESLYLTLPEVSEVLAHSKRHAAHPWIYPMMCTAAHTGVRRSELLRMRLADVDLAGGTLLVREKKKTRGTRTTRRVPLSPFLSEVLNKWTRVHPGGGYLFCQVAGLPNTRSTRTTTGAVTRDDAHDHFRRTLAGSRWGVVRGWHVLRHSFASNCAACGVDQRLIDEWMGHTTEAMPKRYRHLRPGLQQDAIRSVFG